MAESRTCGKWGEEGRGADLPISTKLGGQDEEKVSEKKEAEGGRSRWWGSVLHGVCGGWAGLAPPLRFASHAAEQKPAQQLCGDQLTGFTRRDMISNVSSTGFV